MEGDSAHNGNTVKIAGIQFATVDDVDKNVARAKELLALAHERGARVASFAELFSSPWFPVQTNADPTPFSQTVPGPLVEEFSSLARLYEMVIVLPLCEAKGAAHL